VQCKRGPSVLQPYRDLRKLLRKGSATSDQVSWIFHGAPLVAFAWYLTVSAIVPIITDEPLPLALLADLIGGAFVLSLASFAISLAAFDTASPFGGLGASRWLGSFAEPALILVFFTVGALSRSDNPYLENHALASSGAAYVLPTHMLGAIAFFMLVLAETGRITIDNPSGAIEISMIEDSRVAREPGAADPERRREPLPVLRVRGGSDRICRVHAVAARRSRSIQRAGPRAAPPHLSPC